MSKRLICGFLSVLLLASVAVPVYAQETEEEVPSVYTITSREEFLNFAEQCRLDSFSQELTVSLDSDLDLSGEEFRGIPIFCGTFLGNGHTIRGVTLEENGSFQGLFRYLTDTARVESLCLEGVVSPGGSAGETGALAGSNAGHIINCSFSGTVSGNENIGGLVGINAVSGVVEDCRVEGFVSGNHFIGGIAGKNNGVIRSCENKAQVNTTAQQNNVNLSDITLESLTKSEAASTVTDIGGIAGRSVGVIRACINRGDVGYRHMGYNIGGIAGTQSGYIAECTNYGQIMGRKEVGGIAGQMEPTTLIEYKEDALQILQRQLNSLGGIVNETAGNLQGGAQGLYFHVDALRGSITNAEEALQSLIPSEEGGLPDQDTIQAAKNTLSGSMASMTDTLRGMGAVTESVVGTLSNNLHAIQNQMNAMRTTLGNAKETLGGSITDMSDQDTDENLTGKVERCVNYGDILADWNAGGITGAMAVENDLDHEEDISIQGSNSLNFTSELRCIIKNCQNESFVTVGKHNAGGIVGWQSLGLVKGCYNSGTLDAATADHVGGVTGQGEGFIRSSGAKCSISGNNFVGGIAGSAVIVTDCLSMVKFLEGNENLGAILGKQEEGFHEEETPVAGNRYLRVDGDVGGIDGISYAAVAEPMTLDAFLAQEDLPDRFRYVEVIFRYENGGESRFRLVPGEAFPEEKIPTLPGKSGYTAQWAGLEEADLEQVFFNLTFEAEYAAFDQVLASSDGEKPLILIQGDFMPQSELTIEDWTESVPLKDNEALLKAKTFSVSDTENIHTLRFCLYDMEPVRTKLLLLGSDNTWREAEFTVDGSYAVMALEPGDQAVALVLLPENHWMQIGAGALMAAVVLGGLLLYRKRKNVSGSENIR